MLIFLESQHTFMCVDLSGMKLILDLYLLQHLKFLFSLHLLLFVSLYIKSTLSEHAQR